MSWTRREIRVRFGEKVPGSRETVREELCASLVPEGQVHFLRQVHGCAIAEAPWDAPPEADGGVTSQLGVFLAIETADCLPLFIFDEERGTLGAAHAGWRGTSLRIAERLVHALLARQARLQDLRALLGPCIGSCCYEVGQDVFQAFHEDARLFVQKPSDKWLFNLRAANRAQLQAAGLAPHQMADTPHCTFCRSDLYFSYRRNGPNAGRMISYAGFFASGSSAARHMNHAAAER